MQMAINLLGHVLFEMSTGREVGKYPPTPDEWEDVTNRDLQEVSLLFSMLVYNPNNIYFFTRMRSGDEKTRL